MATALGRGHEAPAGAGGVLLAPGGGPAPCSAPVFPAGAGAPGSPRTPMLQRGARGCERPGRSRSTAGLGRERGGSAKMSQCRREPGESWGCGGLWLGVFFVLFFFVFPVESSNLSPAFWDPGGTVETPCGQALGGDGSAGRCGRRRPAPLGNRPPRAEPKQQHCRGFTFQAAPAPLPTLQLAAGDASHGRKHRVEREDAGVVAPLAPFSSPAAPPGQMEPGPRDAAAADPKFPSPRPRSPSAPNSEVQGWGSAWHPLWGL